MHWLFKSIKEYLLDYRWADVLLAIFRMKLKFKMWLLKYIGLLLQKTIFSGLEIQLNRFFTFIYIRDLKDSQ